MNVYMNTHTDTHTHTSICGYMHVSTSAWKTYNSALDLRVIEVQVVVGHLTWVLRTKLRSSIRAVCAENSSASSPTPAYQFLKAFIPIQLTAAGNDGKPDTCYLTTHPPCSPFLPSVVSMETKAALPSICLLNGLDKSL